MSLLELKEGDFADPGVEKREENLQEEIYQRRLIFTVKNTRGRFLSEEKGEMIDSKPEFPFPKLVVN